MDENDRSQQINDRIRENTGAGQQPQAPAVSEEAEAGPGGQDAPRAERSGGAGSPFGEPPRGDRTPPKPAKARKEKRGLGAGAVVALCLVCALIGGLTGAGAGHMAADRAASALTTGQRSLPQAGDQAESGESQDQDSQGSSLPAAKTVDTSAEMDPAQIYETYVGSTVGITVDIVTTNIFGQTVTGAAAGSGFVITEDGYILTNYHVIKQANAINVAFSDGSTYPATLIGGEEENDIAVIKIDATGLTPVVLGKSSDMKVGQEVVAIGNPLGELTFSETHGIVSAVNRVITTSASERINMIQTDCAINSGNSGGPLFNTHGEVIGITTAKPSIYASGSGAAVEGITFAIPMDDVSAMVQDLVEKGYVSGKPYLGIVMSQNGVSLAAQAYGVPAGVPVLGVTPGLSADQAGIQENDIIVKLGDTETDSGAALSTAVNQTKPGDKVTVTVYRSGETLELTVTIGEETAEASAATQKVSDEITKKQQEAYQQEQQQQQPNGGGYYGWPFGSFGF